MSKLLTHFTTQELEMIFAVSEAKRMNLGLNNCYGKDYDRLGSIMKKIEVHIKTDACK